MRTEWTGEWTDCGLSPLVHSAKLSTGVLPANLMTCTSSRGRHVTDNPS